MIAWKLSSLNSNQRLELPGLTEDKPLPTLEVNTVLWLNNVSLLLEVKLPMTEHSLSACRGMIALISISTVKCLMETVAISAERHLSLGLNLMLISKLTTWEAKLKTFSSSLTAWMETTNILSATTPAMDVPPISHLSSINSARKSTKAKELHLLEALRFKEVKTPLSSPLEWREARLKELLLPLEPMMSL